MPGERDGGIVPNGTTSGGILTIAVQNQGIAVTKNQSRQEMEGIPNASSGTITRIKWNVRFSSRRGYVKPDGSEIPSQVASASCQKSSSVVAR